MRDNDNLELTRSNPSISPLGSGMIETPLGVGLGTRFQARNNPRVLEQQIRAEKMCKDLFKDLDIWIAAMKSSPPPELLVIVEGYERFKRRIQRSSEEAILRRLSTQYTFQLSDYLVQLQTLKKRAERRERRDLNNLISRPSTSTDESEGEEENVFQHEVPPPSLIPVIIVNQLRITCYLHLLKKWNQNQRRRKPNLSQEDPPFLSLLMILFML